MSVRKLTLLCLGLAGCSSSNQFHFHLEGTVRTLEQGAPIVGATATLSYQSGPFEMSSLTTQTDAGGNYTFDTPELPCSNVVLSVSSSGYKTATATVDCTDEAQRLDFALVPAG
ncbi:MAG: carboxypeptidase regulatory-like domain-containing protein [Gemmatimonadetes bacterium]|nr:carboxypeptidase regulatory-like domain-containing protein [Gemmatimonadota bacterium]